MADDADGAGKGDFGGILPSAANRGGRPRGSKNKRSTDLGRYIEAVFGGMTPGQQAAQLCMVTPTEVREARNATHGLNLPADLILSPLALAMVVKARRLASALRCDPKEAWLLMQREREGLMAYVHQKQPQAADRSSAPRPVAFVVPEGDETSTPLLALMDDDSIEFVGPNQPENEQVTGPKSPDQVK